MENKDYTKDFKFYGFLKRFGVDGMKEYKTFTEKEKAICIREYHRYLLEEEKNKSRKDRLLDKIVADIN